MLKDILSIVIPAYNSADTIGICIESIEKNQNKEFEIVIIDDGSTDGQNSVIRSYMDRFHNIRLISQENTGCVGARMKGFVSAEGNYCTTIDSDDFVSENYVDRIRNLISENPDIDMFFLNNYRNDDGPQLFSVERAMKDELQDDKSECLNRIWFRQEGAIWNKVFRTEYFEYCSEKLGNHLNIIFAEDLLINTVYLSNPKVKKILFKNLAEYYHNEMFGVTSSSRFNSRKLRDAYGRVTALGKHVFGQGAFDNRIESEVLYWNIRYLIYQQAGLRDFKKDKYEMWSTDSIYKIAKKYRCYTAKQLFTRIVCLMLRD